MSFTNMVSGGRGSISAGHNYNKQGTRSKTAEIKPIRRIQPIYLDDNKLEAEINKYFLK